MHIIDDRLFQPFNFRDQFDVRPIFVNDDLVDLSIHPTSPRQTRFRGVATGFRCIGHRKQADYRHSALSGDAYSKPGSAAVHWQARLRGGP